MGKKNDYSRWKKSLFSGKEVCEEKSLCGGRHYANISAYLRRGRWHKRRFIPVPLLRRPAISQHMVYPRRYSARTHFGNRGTVDVRVERRLAPSGGDDKSSCGWRGSGSGSFYGSPSRKEENSYGRGARTGGRRIFDSIM